MNYIIYFYFIYLFYFIFFFFFFLGGGGGVRNIDFLGRYEDFVDIFFWGGGGGGGGHDEIGLVLGVSSMYFTC